MVLFGGLGVTLRGARVFDFTGRNQILNVRSAAKHAARANATSGWAPILSDPGPFVFVL